MKRFLNSVILFLVVCFVGIINISAADLKPGGTFDFTFSGVPTNGINDYILGYDHNVVYPNENRSCYNNGTKKIIKDTCKITFNIISNTKATSTTVRVYKDDPGSGNPTLEPNAMTVKIDQPNAEQTQSSTTAAANKKSNNANLKTLTITGNDNSNVELSPSFKPEVYDYSADVNSTVSKLNIVATAEDAKSNIVISNNANEELKSGETTKITITVTAEDGTKKAYTLNITRQILASDATLKSLTIEEVKDFLFDPEKSIYDINLDSKIEKLTINYELDDENSVVEIVGNEKLTNGSKIKITVVAPDGTKKVYTLNIIKTVITTKAKIVTSTTDKNPLIVIGLSLVAFGLAGGIYFVLKK